MATQKSGHTTSKNAARKVAFMGLLFGMAMVFSLVESMALPTLPMGVKLGLSNIVTMYCLFFLGLKSGLTLAVLKSFFVFITRGVVAATISLSGGLFSVLVMFVLLSLKKLNLSYILVSVAGAVAHNVGQLFVVQFVVGTDRVFVLLPILVISGLGMGTVTGIVLKVVSPYMNKLGLSL